MRFKPLSLSDSHVAILGAGLMGRLLAFALASEGCRVDIHDAAGPDAGGAAARVAAAMLAPLAESAVSEPAVVAMGLHGLRRWPQILSTLSSPVFFQQNGTLVVWHWQDATEASRLRATLEHSATTLKDLTPLALLDEAALATQEPALAERFHEAYFLQGEGQLDNRQLLGALLADMQRLGVKTHWHSPKSPADFSPATTGQPDCVLDCRGLGARADWPALRGVRGEVIRLHAPEVSLQRPVRLVHPRYPLYIAPKQDHLFVIGATEIESDDLSPASVRSTLELLSAAYTVHSGFAEARIVEIATQCRPALSDNNPGLRILNERTLQINGLYRHGFMIAPAMLDATLAMLRDGSSALAEQLQLQIDTAL